MRFILSLLFILYMNPEVYACDLCGCSAGNNAMGILPSFKNHFVGMRYQYRSFNTKHPSIHGPSESLYGVDRFQSWELLSRWSVHEKLQVFMTIPMHNIKRNEDVISYHTSGLGDISVMLMGVVFDNTQDVSGIFSHALQAGLGIKVPLGTYELRQDGFLIHPNLQPGTGTWDVPLSAIYTVRYNSWGLNTEFQYRLNGTNSLNYQYGDNILLAGRIFYWYGGNGYTLLPQVGIQYDHRNNDKRGQTIDPYTGGNQVLFSTACDVYFGNIAAGFTWSLPISQQLGDGFVTAKPSMTARVFYLF